MEVRYPSHALARCQHPPLRDSGMDWWYEADFGAISFYRFVQVDRLTPRGIAIVGPGIFAKTWGGLETFLVDVENEAKRER